MRLSISLEKLWSWDKCSKRIFCTCFSLFLELFFSFSRFVRVGERNMRLRRDFCFSLQASRVRTFSIFPSFPPSFLFTAQLWKTTSRLGASGLGIILLILFSAAGYRTLFFYNLEQRALAFDLAPLIAERIKEKLRPDETIFGDFGVVPTVALLSGRRIAAAQVDSSVMRFVSGLYKVEDVIAAIEAAHVKAVLTRRGKDI